MKNSSADPCLFYRKRNGNFLYVAIYVDDGMVVGSSDSEVQSFLELLQQEFKITMGNLEIFLGLNIARQKDGSITISQPSYIEKILRKFRMDECNPVYTPVGREEAALTEKNDDHVPYQEAVGSLMYLMTATRPDIAFAVNKTARALHQPTRRDWNDVKKIFKYLKGTANHGIIYKGQDDLKIYSDADFAGDIKTRRSTSGVIALYSGGAVSWSSRLQRSVALSTTEAEIMAASEAAKEAIWLKRLIYELLNESCKRFCLLIAPVLSNLLRILNFTGEVSI